MERIQDGQIIYIQYMLQSVMQKVNILVIQCF